MVTYDSVLYIIHHTNRQNEESDKGIKLGKKRIRNQGIEEENRQRKWERERESVCVWEWKREEKRDSGRKRNIEWEKDREGWSRSWVEILCKDNER